MILHSKIQLQDKILSLQTINHKIWLLLVKFFNITLSVFSTNKKMWRYYLTLHLKSSFMWFYQFPKQTLIQLCSPVTCHQDSTTESCTHGLWTWLVVCGTSMFLFSLARNKYVLIKNIIYQSSLSHQTSAISFQIFMKYSWKERHMKQFFLLLESSMTKIFDN